MHVNVIAGQCFAFVVVLAVSPAGFCGDKEKPGAIAGTVRFLGEVPPDKRIMTTDGGSIMHNDLVVDPKTKGLRHVAVYLEKAPAVKVPPPKAKALVDQRDMLFLPRVVAVREGQTVRFENNDLCNHCVRGASLESANAFNIVTPAGQFYEIDFKAHKHPTVIDCPIHGWMRAYVFTFNHPFFAVTDARGSFQIADVPPGKYNLVFRHMDSMTQEVRPVTVAAGETREVRVDWEKTGEKK